MTERQRRIAMYIRFLLDCACAEPTFYFRQLNGYNLGNALFLHRNAKERVRLVHRRLSVRDNDELRIVCKAFEVRCESI